MFRGIIGLIEGNPEGEIGRNRGANISIEGERITGLGDDELVTGAAAGSVSKERRVPLVGEDYITTEREERTEEVYTEFLADLSGGWVTIDSSDGEFLWDFLALKHKVEIERAEIDLNALTDEVRSWESASVWQAQTDWGDVDAGSGGVTISYHNDASWPSDGEVGQLGFKGLWDGVKLRGIVAQSGYVALFDDATDEIAGQFVADVLLPHCSIPDDAQATLEGGEPA